jgi:CBS domain-containing protein
MEAKDIMTREVVTVSPSLPVKMLANLLIKNQISGAPVADKKGKIVGVVSETDLIAKKGKQVKTIMSNKVVQITEKLRSKKSPGS